LNPAETGNQSIEKLAPDRRALLGGGLGRSVRVKVPETTKTQNPSYELIKKLGSCCHEDLERHDLARMSCLGSFARSLAL
jgi:hypothetical protein